MLGYRKNDSGTHAMKRFWLATAAILATGLGTARAEDITIGAIYPLTGNAAQIGADAQAAIGVISGYHQHRPRSRCPCCSAKAAGCRTCMAPISR